MNRAASELTAFAVLTVVVFLAVVILTLGELVCRAADVIIAKLKGDGRRA